MILKADKIAALLEAAPSSDDPLVITPTPDLDELNRSGSASVDLRLGCWFLGLRQSKVTCLHVADAQHKGDDAKKSTKYVYVPFGQNFVLHPQTFVLGTTLEWIRLCQNLAGVVTGKSSWGRRGLIIATATGVHPGFSGCLTLEITNLGQIPIHIKPGMPICQLFLHAVESDAANRDLSQFNCNRRPILGNIELDPLTKILSSPL